MAMAMTDNARAIMRLALQEARWFGSSSVESVHLLLGMIKHNQGGAARILGELGINFKRLTLALESSAPEKKTGYTSELPPSENLKRIIQAAEGSACARRCARVGSEDLLAGMLEVSDSRAGTLLSRFEVTPEKIAARMTQLQVNRSESELTRCDAADAAQGSMRTAAGSPDPVRNVLRILDANLNRAGEAIRVIEECARFIMNHPVLAQETKGLRHRLHHAMEKLEIPANDLLHARDTTADVGTLLTGVGKLERDSLSAVLRANFRRLTEALRALEEYTKLVKKPSEAFEQLRYDAYHLEKSFAHPGPKRASLDEVNLCVLISHTRTGRSVVEVLEEVLDGGCRMVQLRQKDVPDRELLELARIARRMTHQAGALLVINDRADVAHRVGADGVHVGQTDMPLHEVRGIIGFDKLIGVSAHSTEEAVEAESAGADYIGVGPIFPSRTKPHLKDVGIELLRSVASIRIPYFAIGGITVENVPRVRSLGATRVAASSDIIESPDICERTRQFMELLGSTM